MADYKDMLKNLAAKAKDAADSSGVTEVYAKGAGRAKAFAQITKLTLEANRDLEELGRVYAEIGKLYFEQTGNNPEGFYVPLFEQANRLSAAVRERRSEIDALKAQHLDAGGHAADEGFGDFDAVVSQAEREATEE